MTKPTQNTNAKRPASRLWALPILVSTVAAVALADSYPNASTVFDLAPKPTRAAVVAEPVAAAAEAIVPAAVAAEVTEVAKDLVASIEATANKVRRAPKVELAMAAKSSLKRSVKRHP
jgi:hypothetical protein